MPPLRGEQLGPKKAPSRLRCTYNWWQSREGRAFVSSGLPLSALETWDRPLKQRLRRNPTKTWKQVELDRERAIRAQRKATRVQRRQAASAAANAPPPARSSRQCAGTHSSRQCASSGELGYGGVTGRPASGPGLTLFSPPLLHLTPSRWRLPPSPTLLERSI